MKDIMFSSKQTELMEADFEMQHIYFVYIHDAHSRLCFHFHTNILTIQVIREMPQQITMIRPVNRNSHPIECEHLDTGRRCVVDFVIVWKWTPGFYRYPN